MKKLSLGEEFLIIFTEIKSENKHRGSYLFSETKNSMEVRLFENDNRNRTDVFSFVVNWSRIFNEANKLSL